MWKLTITDTDTGIKEQATVKGSKVLEGFSAGCFGHDPKSTEPYAPSIPMADTIDLLYQFKSPKAVIAMFAECSAPRWTLTLEHI